MYEIWITSHETCFFILFFFFFFWLYWAALSLRHNEDDFKTKLATGARNVKCVPCIGLVPCDSSEQFGDAKSKAKRRGSRTHFLIVFGAIDWE